MDLSLGSLAKCKMPLAYTNFQYHQQQAPYGRQMIAGCLNPAEIVSNYPSFLGITRSVKICYKIYKLGTKKPDRVGLLIVSIENLNQGM